MRYVPLAPAEKYGKCYSFEGWFREFVKRCPGLHADDVFCRREVILDIVERVEKRRVYFRVFHGLVLSERNEMALYCFWTIKLAPFVNMKKPGHPVNAVFAAFLFLQMLKNVSRCTKRPAPVSRKYAQNLAYAFAYHDLSKEAVMAMADALLTGAAVLTEDGNG
jgi:hypothetical protein